MKSKSKSSRVLDRYGMIEALEPRIAPATVTPGLLPTNPANYKTVSVGGSLLLKAGDVLTTGSGTGGIYLMYVEAGEVMVHTTDLNGNQQFDFNEITGLSVGAGTQLVSFVDIHGDVVTDLNPDGTLSDNGKGDILLDYNIAGIDLRSLQTTDFTPSATQSLDAQVTAHLALTSYSIYGNIYAGAGLGLPNNPTSGLQINPNQTSLQQSIFNGVTSTDYYQSTEPVIGSIYVGSAASGHAFNFGASGQGMAIGNAAPLDIHGNLLAFVPAPGETGASVYNISSVGNVPFSIGTIQAGNGGFNAPGGSIVNVALQGDNAGVYQLIAGNAGNGTTGQNGGSIVNFSETGTVISEVVLQSGNGGTGLTGAGGNAGVINFNPADVTAVNAHFVLNYGNGGDGYTGGGNGGGTTIGNFVTPTGKLTTAQDFVATMHVPGSIGTTTPFDFNNDGVSDAVFATTNPNQVVVAFGSYNSNSELFGLNYHSYIYLNSPAQVESIVVGDFNGAYIPNTHVAGTNHGVPAEDIAVASSGPNYSGIEVYLSEYNPKTGAFEGFSDPLITPLPSLIEGGYIYTTTPITKIVAGDFNGNGVLGLAVLAQETIEVSLAVHSVVIFLDGETDAAHTAGTGYFYANFANGNLPYIDLNEELNGFSPTQGTFQVTALQQFQPNVPGSNVSNGQDVIIVANIGAESFSVLQYNEYNPNAGLYGFGEPFLSGGGAFGDVLVPGAKSPTAFHLFGLAVTQDQNNPSIADIVAVSSAPQGFIVTLGGGNGAGAFTNGAPEGTFTLTSQPNVGIDFANGTNFAPAAVITVPSTTGKHQSGLYSDVAILDYDTAPADTIFVMNVFFDTSLAPTPANGVTGYMNATLAEAVGLYYPIEGRDTANVAFDAYYPYPVYNAAVTGSGPGEFGFGFGIPLSSYLQGDQSIEIKEPFESLPLGGGATETLFFDGPLAPFKDAGYFIYAGHGGNSQSGSGGAGGSLGLSLTETVVNGVTTGLGTLNIEFPADVTYEGTARIVAGAGGNGFTNGGAGGTLTGISLTYANGVGSLTGGALLYAGNGGESLTATGGSGGSLSQLFIVTGEFFVAGNGGVGIVGGNGGSIIGNNGYLSAEANNYDLQIALKGGDGAVGINGGGNGGAINSFEDEFGTTVGVSVPQIYGVGEVLDYIAGNGGNAVAGRAGTGGYVINSSPYSLLNTLVGDIYLQGGNGGTGLYGGNGGGVANFNQDSTVKDEPFSLTVIAGAGGKATLGVGGTGGGVSNITASADGTVGTIYTFNYSDPNITSNLDDALLTETFIQYNRIVAGPGGVSLGGGGGAGGTVTNIDVASVATNSAFVVAAGAGGQGLTAGGNGGSVTSATVDAGAQATEGKVVIIAGDGGNSISGKPADPTNPSEVVLAIGAVDGSGGNGGSIVNFVQPANTDAHVDLIAGNGGSTVNHSYAAEVAAGFAHPSADNSGTGGSILNINVTGSIGNSDPNTAIISYNDISVGQTMQDFVDNFVLGLNGNQANLQLAMTDAVGNVGIVAGAVGYVEGIAQSPGTSIYVPAPGTLEAPFSGDSGSVNNVVARAIMSMVAGNVDQVTYIQSLTNYSVSVKGGILGAPKLVSDLGYTNDIIAGDLNYINPDGDVEHTGAPLDGGALIDGAFMALNIRPLQSNRDFEGTQ